MKAFFCPSASMVYFMELASMFSIAKMVVEITKAATIKFNRVDWFCFFTLGANTYFSSQFWFMNLHMLTARHNVKIFYSVVVCDFVKVMNNFVREKVTSKMFFHNNNMLVNVFPITGCSGMTNGTDQDIPRIARFPAFPKWELFHSVSSLYEILISHCFAITFSCNRYFMFGFGGMFH